MVVVVCLPTDFPDRSIRLRDGKSIHTVSALLFQLVQTSPHQLRYECQSLAKQRKYAPPPEKDQLLTDSERAVSEFKRPVRQSSDCIILGNRSIHQRA
jgi:hypothetical protein